uniref:GPS domain-containing protein n=1 Tax=Globodera pallida TaxID=36090 RepID=A0A183C6Y2_GLOPA
MVKLADAPCTPVSAVFDTLEQPTILLDYLDTLSQSICVMATEHSANKLFERQFELVNQLSDAMANEVIESVLRLASSTIEEPSKNAIDEAAHSLLDVVAHSVEQNEKKLEIDVSLKELHSVDLKSISMDQLETGDHNCYTILVEERAERRMTEEAINFVPTTLTTMRNGGGFGGLSSKSSSFSSTNGSAACPNSAGVVAVAHRESFESGSTSGADSEPSSSDSVDVGAAKMPFGIVPTEKEQLLDIGSPKEEQMFDIVPKVLDIVPKEEQILDIEYCSVVSCVKGESVTMSWGCKDHDNCTEIADRASIGNDTCRCKMGKKGVNLSNEKLSFPPEAPAVTTEGK